MLRGSSGTLLDEVKEPLNNSKKAASHRKDAKRAKVFPIKTLVFLGVLCAFAVNKYCSDVPKVNFPLECSITSYLYSNAISHALAHLAIASSDSYILSVQTKIDEACALARRHAGRVEPLPNAAMRERMAWHLAQL